MRDSLARSSSFFVVLVVASVVSASASANAK